MFEQHLLPPGARLIHVGPPKTGSTALQYALHGNRSALPAHGVRYAGQGTRPKKALRQLTQRSGGRPAAWEALAAEVADAGDLRVCVSNEDFAAVDARTAGRIGRDLGGDRAHVALVARPMEKLLPSQWQQRVRRSRNAAPYDEWLRTVLLGEAGHPDHTHFWARHDLAAQVAKWSEATAPDRVRVVVAKEGDHDFLLRVFEGLLGLPEGMLALVEGKSNSSLSWSGAELLRTLDGLVAEADVDERRYTAELKPALSKFLRVSGRDPEDRPIQLPGWAQERVRELNRQRAELLGSGPFEVIGVPADLVGGTLGEPRDDGAPQVARVPVPVVAGLLATLLERTTGAPSAPAAPAAPPGPRRRPTTGLDRVPAGELARELARRLRRRPR